MSKPRKNDRIRAAYVRIEEGEPDISTERLLQMTADQCRCDVADVCEALHETKPNEQTTKKD